MFPQKAATGYHIILRFLSLFHKKKLLFLQVVSAPSPDVLKESELSYMTTFEMNTEKKLGLLLMAFSNYQISG